MEIKFYLLFLFLIHFQIISIGQTYTTIAAGDIESSQTWQNGEVPPFVIIGDQLEIPIDVELKIFHEMSSTKSEVVNRGKVHIVYNEYDDPTIFWRNFGNIDFSGWAPDTGKFINEPTGQILFRANSIYCQHIGCGSENYGTIYVNICVSNICAYDSTSRFINHEGAEIIICETGYLENYWRLPGAGNIDNLVFINNGTIRADDDSPSGGIINWGNDFFNNMPNSMGTYEGAIPTVEPEIACIWDLPDIMTSIEVPDDQKRVSVFPNPSIGNIFIDTALEFDQVNVINSVGQIEKTLTYDDTRSEINLNLPTGVYLLQFQKKSKIITNTKVIIFDR